MRYAHAELLYEMGRYPNAIVTYAFVAVEHPDGKRAAFCAAPAVFAAEQMLALRQPDGSRDGASGLDDDQETLLAALDLAMDRPDDIKTQPLAYKAAFLLYDNDALDDAVERFRTIVDLDPDSVEAERTAELLADALRSLGRDDEADREDRSER